jgi:hypothetical protein
MTNNFNITEQAFQQAIINVLAEGRAATMLVASMTGWHGLHKEAMAKCFAEFAGNADDQFTLRAAWSIFQKTGGYVF